MRNLSQNLAGDPGCVSHPMLENREKNQKVFYQPQEQEEFLPTQNIRSKWGHSTDLESLGELQSTEPPALSGRGVYGCVEGEHD